jgi:[acyl-carrier-protein] S-malonyltransferase
MSDLALVFPGQGSQFVGMGQALYREFSSARETFEEASEAVSLDLAKLCFEGPKDTLGLTEYTQPCVLTASMAAYNVLKAETGLSPLVAAGHSLGEYTALTAAGAISLADAVQAVRERARLMEQAVPAGEGAMAAVMKVTRDEIEKACRESCEDGIVVPANDNAPEQVVISGHAACVDRAVETLKSRGGRTRKLKVSGPFHTGLMGPAAQQMEEVLERIDFKSLSFPVLANCNARPYPEDNGARKNLCSQIVSPVLWRQTVEEMDRQGARAYLEVGPGKVLAGLVSRCLPDAKVMGFMEPGDLAEIKSRIPE